MSSPPYECTPLEEIDRIHAELHATFLSASLSSLSSSAPSTNGTFNTPPFPLLSIPYRTHQVLQIARLCQENADAICDALFQDLGKPREEVLLAEVGAVIERALITAQKVEEWVTGGDAEKVEMSAGWQKNWKAKVERRAKGVGLVISPWNYPLILTFQPLLGAVAAGCPAAIKLSEVVPQFSSLMAKLVEKYLDPRAYRVVLGGVKEITRVLQLKWDQIFYTGNGRVARIISAAAARHLTPMTLELGGKSPVIVHPETCGDLETAARRIIWGKINNAGQICIAPDYVLIPTTSIPSFVSAVSKALKTFFPKGALHPESSYARIVSQTHFKRIKGLLEGTKGKVVLGGQTGPGSVTSTPDRGIEPTVVVFPETMSLEEIGKDVLMEEELFAPVLPVIGVKSLEEGLEFVRRRDHPLVIYAFTEDKSLQEKILNSTMSGNFVFNDTFQQLASNDIPFGGVGESGHGRQVLKYTFDEFTYLRSVVDIPQSDEPGFVGRYPPSTAQSVAFAEGCLKIAIPSGGGRKAAL
ncbi:hypothetical protein H1R20_g12326, partial [Candolleomyces eurysporus]